MSVAQIVLLSALMVATGALGAITGGNSLINVPLMITVGMAPRQAVATNMFAVVFMALHKKGAPAAPTPGRRMAGYLGTALLGVYGGFFSGGYTTLMTVLCTVCFGLTMIESVAVTKPVNLLSCAAASVVFFAGGLIDLRVGVPLAAANLVGGWLGAHAALKGGDRFVRLLFLLTVSALAAKLLVWDLLLRR